MTTWVFVSIKLDVRGLTRSVAIFIFISIMIVHMKQSLCNVMKYLYKIPNTMGSSQQRVIIVLHIDIYVWLNECCSINMSWSIKIVVMISAAFIRALRQYWIGDWQHDFPFIGCGPDHFGKKQSQYHGCWCLKFTLIGVDRIISKKKQGQYHGCLCLGALRRQAINSFAIDYVC